MRMTGSLTLCGPGGPYIPVTECSDFFSSIHGCHVRVIKSEPSCWRSVWDHGVDIFYAGSDSMLQDFDRENPVILDLSSLIPLYSRPVGILVRPGNPMGISCLEDLGRKGARLLDVQLETMESFQCSAHRGGRGIFRSVITGEQGRDAWLATPDIDAWITYRTWHVSLAGASDFVPIAERDDAIRSAPLAITRNSSNRELAEFFIAFLKSEEAHRIFQKYGWN